MSSQARSCIHAKQVFRKIETRADESREVNSTELGIDVDDDFMAISEDDEDNDDKPQQTSNNKAATFAESNGENSTAKAVNNAGFTGARFP